MEAHELDLLRQVLTALGSEAEIYNGKGKIPHYDGSKPLLSTSKLPISAVPFILSVKESGHDGWLWVYPQESSKPLFLQQPDIFPSSQIRVSAGTRLAFSMGLGSSQADEKVYCYAQTNPFLPLLDKTGDKDFVLHIRSNGRSGTACAYTGKEGVIAHQVKMAFTQEGFTKLNHEAGFLKQWAGKMAEKQIVPQSVALYNGIKESGISILPYLRLKKYVATEEFGTAHFEFLNTLYLKSAQKGPLKFAPFWQETGKTVQNLGGWLNHHASNPECQELPNGLALGQLISLSDRLIYVWQLLDDMPEIIVAQAHNNFGNAYCYVADGVFVVQDWEDNYAGLPLLSDLFHYYFQPNVLLQPEGPKIIKAAITKALQRAEGQELVNSMALDVRLYYLLFMLWHISREAWKHSRSFKAHQLSQDWLQIAENALKAEIDELQSR